jgi:hypothetical protein
MVGVSVDVGLGAALGVGLGCAGVPEHLGGACESQSTSYCYLHGSFIMAMIYNVAR